jgi:Predicted acetyltransferase
MIGIELLHASSSPSLLKSSRDLLLAYGDFLRAGGEHQGFSFDDLKSEALDLPAAYSDAGGAVLVAVEEGRAIGCIAFRAFPACGEPDCCEIKRLFVRPEFRGRAIGLQLGRAALEQARAKGYRSAYLDTAPISMAAAYRTYLKLGFVEYDRRGAALALLRKSLT